MEAADGSHEMNAAEWKLRSGSHRMKVTKWNLRNGSRGVEAADESHGVEAAK